MLKHGYSKKSIGHNIETEIGEGKPRSEAIAIALQTARNAKKKNYANGGMVEGDNDTKALFHPLEIIEAIKAKRQEHQDFLSDEMPEHEQHVADEELNHLEMHAESDPHEDDEHDIKSKRKGLIEQAFQKSRHK